jgi:hypothetical protein
VAPARSPDGQRFLCKPRLARTRIAEEHDQSTPAGPRSVNALEHSGTWCLAPDQSNAVIPPRGVDNRCARWRRGRQVDGHAAQGAADISEGLEPRGGIFREQTLEQRVERPRNRRNPIVKISDRLVEDGREGRICARSNERVCTRKRFIQENAEREDIRPSIRRFPQNLFWGHIGRRTSEHSFRLRRRQRGPMIGRVLLGQPRGQAEVHDFGVPVFGQHHVRRLEIVMHDAPLVGGVERFGDLFGEPQSLAGRQRSAAKPAFEGLAVDVFHRDARTPVQRRHFVDRADERMIERCRCARLTQELFQAVRLAGGRDELQCHLPMQHHVVGEAHFSHASSPDDFDDPVTWPGGHALTRPSLLMSNLPECDIPVTDVPG